ncbi:MAG: phosphoribosyltransferase family protein [Bauldia sp.]
MPRERVLFTDRRDAGRRLASALGRFAGRDPVILALPRGGVPVAFEVAQALKAPLDLLMVRKIGVPGRPELALGAVVDGRDPQIVINEDVAAIAAPPEGYVDEVAREELDEIERRRGLYGRGRAPVDCRGRMAIVVDDGIATGATMKAALKGLARQGAKRIVLAVPVAPEEALADLKAEADEILALSTPEPFLSVGSHYRDFTQTSDAEVIEFLERAAAPQTLPAAHGGASR